MLRSITTTKIFTPLMFLRPTLYPIKRRHFSNVELVYNLAENITFYGIFLPNLYIGCRLLNSDSISKDYNFVGMFTFTLIKCWIYSWYWWIFWPYALTRPLILPKEDCYISFSQIEKWDHNFNGLVRHFIPGYYGVVKPYRTISIDQLKDENSYLVNFFPVISNKVNNMLVPILSKIRPYLGKFL